MKLAETPEVIT
jgi:hypothetical protein